MNTKTNLPPLHLIPELKEQVLDATGFSGKTAVILGSGLGAISDSLSEKNAVSYSELNGFPVSTVEGHSGEIITGGELGMRVLTLSCLTNYAAGITNEPLTHAEVIATADQSGATFTELIITIIAQLHKEKD